MRIVGVDFTSAPSRDKRITVALGRLRGSLEIEGFAEFSDFPAFELWLADEAPWIGGFDFPFGLPARFVARRRWPGRWPEMVRACVQGGKERFVSEAMAAFMAAAGPLDKHRATDLAAGSHSPLKTRTNPPVGRMFYEGAWRLLASGVRIPALRVTRSSRIALEAYPGLLARRIGFARYKNDRPANAAARRAARRAILGRLQTEDNPAGVALRLAPALGRRVVADASGDLLDALLCAAQAAWAALRRADNFGLPPRVDPREGWIVSA